MADRARARQGASPTAPARSEPAARFDPRAPRTSGAADPYAVEPEARAWIEIDLGALGRNFRAISKLVAPARLLPVLKADAYGHGAAEVARALEPLGAAGFAVARPAEGVALRRSGVSARILVFAPTSSLELGTLARFDLTPVVSDLEQLDELEAFAAATGWRPRVHLKVDTGMHRLGVPLAAAGEAMARLRASPVLDWEGLLSHLASAEERVSPRTAEQLAAFEGLVEGLKPGERSRLELHLANGAGALLHPETRFDLVRPGLALYGGAPAGSPIELEPVLSLRAQILQLKRVEEGESVGYGGRWTASRPSRLGIVGVGYADGFPWRAGAAGSAQALVRGRRAPLVGAVSMDLLAVDLTESGGEVGEELVLLGRQGSDAIRVEELARAAGTLPYEILCGLRLRLPRRVVEEGAATGERARQPSRPESGE